jgi:hypothetical protein
MEWLGFATNGIQGIGRKYKDFLVNYINDKGNEGLEGRGRDCDKWSVRICDKWNTGD